MTLADLKGLVEAEMSIPTAQQGLSHNGIALSDNNKTYVFRIYLCFQLNYNDFQNTTNWSGSG
jgi:hypothetical protein